MIIDLIATKVEHEIKQIKQIKRPDHLVDFCESGPSSVDVTRFWERFVLGYRSTNTIEDSWSAVYDTSETASDSSIITTWTPSITAATTTLNEPTWTITVNIC